MGFGWGLRLSLLGFFHLGNLGFTAWQLSSKGVSERGRKCSLGGGPITFYDLGLGARQGHFAAFIVVETVTKSLKSKICHTFFIPLDPTSFCDEGQ